MTALPRELPVRLTIPAAIHAAYPIVLEFEQSARNHADPMRIIYARILGYLILEGPEDTARITVARDILACDGRGEDALASLGRLYFDYFIRPCKLSHSFWVARVK